MLLAGSAAASGAELRAIEYSVVALLSGLLIGLEREKARAALARRHSAKPGLEEIVSKEYPGLRTFSLLALYGSLVGFLADKGDGWLYVSLLLASAFLVVLFVFAVHRILRVRTAGVTTIIVMLIDFVAGLLAGLGYLLVAASTAVLTTFILAIKLPAERLVGRLNYEELLWSLELGIVLVVIGPFFLRSSWSLYGVSLRSIYLFFALVLTTSYLGYIAVRLKGSEGLGYAALFGGLANSEAAFTALLSLLPGDLRSYYSFSIALLSNTAMIGRNLVIALAALYVATGGVVSGRVGSALVLAFLLSMSPGVVAWRRLSRGSGPRSEATIPLMENPLRFSTAAKLTVLYLAISFAAYEVRHLGVASLVLVAALGGFISSGATILAFMSVPGIAASHFAALAIIATAASVVNKVFFASPVAGSKGVVLRVSAAVLLQAALMLPGLLLLF